MPRFFFNIRHRDGTAGLAIDEEGDDLANVQAAHEHALSAARKMIAKDRLTLIRDWMVCSFEIVNEARQPVLTVPFSETVREDIDEIHLSADENHVGRIRLERKE